MDVPFLCWAGLQCIQISGLGGQRDFIRIIPSRLVTFERRYLGFFEQKRTYRHCVAENQSESENGEKKKLARAAGPVRA